MTQYETIFIAHPDLNESGVGNISKNVSKIIEKHQGKVLNSNDWGTRRLGYKIRKQEKGRYICLNYSANPGVVAELERMLQLSEDILKQMTIRLPKEK